MNLYAGYFSMFGAIDPMGLVTFVHGPSVPPDPTGINEHNIVSIGGGAAPVYGSGSGYGSQDSLNGLAAFEFVEKNIPAPAEIAIMGWGDYDEQLAGLRQARNSGRFSKACKCIKQGAKNFFNKLFGKTPKMESGLGNNPFKGKTASEVDKMLKNRGFKVSGDDPANGYGGYVNPESGRSYHIDPKEFGRYREPNHVDVNRVRLKKVIPKRKYPYKE